MSYCQLVTFRSKFQWNLNQKSKWNDFHSRCVAFQNVICKMVALFFGPECVSLNHTPTYPKPSLSLRFKFSFLLHLCLSFLFSFECFGILHSSSLSILLTALSCLCLLTSARCLKWVNRQNFDPDFQPPITIAEYTHWDVVMHAMGPIGGLPKCVLIYIFGWHRGSSGQRPCVRLLHSLLHCHLAGLCEDPCSAAIRDRERSSRG